MPLLPATRTRRGAALAFAPGLPLRGRALFCRSREEAAAGAGVGSSRAGGCGCSVRHTVMCEPSAAPGAQDRSRELGAPGTPSSSREGTCPHHPGGAHGRGRPVGPQCTPAWEVPTMLVLVGLVLCLAPADALTAFPPKFQVGKLNGDVVVKCNTSEQQVTWTQNGELEPMAELVAEGQTLTILGLDLPAAGNYSCWAGTVLLDTTYVVVSGTCKEGMNVSCQAASYRGSFHCSWTGPDSAVFRARLTRRWVPPGPPQPGSSPVAAQPSRLPPPSSDGSLGEWVPVASHHSQFSANFTDPSFCPFAEELHPLQLQLEGLSDNSYLNFSTHGEGSSSTWPGPPRPPGRSPSPTSPCSTGCSTSSTTAPRCPDGPLPHGGSQACARPSLPHSSLRGPGSLPAQGSARGVLTYG
ncbi:PREDICTED: interleukin-12 subunit beta-like [Nipponia nippon]|uniref:interleukin-12 subunit beta-like n=1 Tax=Nipponia nippon TaxID=128390 RepID=UPI000511952A|nr:PREDICTED: interleukin-12 subunit beta-like [Nipponia nippon]